MRGAGGGGLEAARPLHLVGNIAQCPEPQEPEPITSLYNRISLPGLRPAPAGLGMGEGSRMEEVSSGFTTGGARGPA